MTFHLHLTRARRGVAYLLLAVAILAALGAERVDPDVTPPQYHGIRPQRGDLHR